MELDDKFYAQRLNPTNATYQVKNLRRFRDLTPSAVHILDLGANIGSNTIEYATWAKQVTSYEPTPHIFDWLTQNVEYNQQHWSPEHHWYADASLEMTAQVTLKNLAVGAENIQTTIINHHRNGGQNHLAAGSRYASAEQFPVTVVRIDDEHLTDVSGIKMDIEGWELYALQGAEQTIMRDRPIIQTEIILAQCRRAGYHPQDLCDWLQTRDYVRTLVTGEVMPPEWVKTPRMCDSFWIPRERI
jgi:FkbM family methyltransferase